MIRESKERAWFTFQSYIPASTMDLVPWQSTESESPLPSWTLCPWRLVHVTVCDGCEPASHTLKRKLYHGRITCTFYGAKLRFSALFNVPQLGCRESQASHSRVANVCLLQHQGTEDGAALTSSTSTEPKAS